MNRPTDAVRTMIRRRIENRLHIESDFSPIYNELNGKHWIEMVARGGWIRWMPRDIFLRKYRYAQKRI
jgi:hypothetical protein